MSAPIDAPTTKSGRIEFSSSPQHPRFPGAEQTARGKNHRGFHQAGSRAAAAVSTYHSAMALPKVPIWAGVWNGSYLACQCALKRLCFVPAGHQHQCVKGGAERPGQQRDALVRLRRNGHRGRDAGGVANQRLAREQAGCVRVSSHAAMHYIEYGNGSLRDSEKPADFVRVADGGLHSRQLTVDAMNVL